MGLSVIGAGLWRTGTMSLKVGLEQLGFGPCHHMEELFADPIQVPPWQGAVAGEPTNWDAVFAGYNSTTDYPGAFFWRELAEFYPDAKVVLTVRTAESWWGSYSSTIMKFLQNVPDDVLPHIGEICEMSKVLMISSDCHAGALPAMYEEYMPKQYHEAVGSSPARRTN